MIGNFYHSAGAVFKNFRNNILNYFDTPVIVLLYHRVAKLRSDPQLLSVSPENFEAHLKILKCSFPIIRFEDDWSSINEPSIAITFDDGYSDNVLNALPLLESNKIPATFFISTGSLNKDSEFWWDELESIILLEEKIPDAFEFTFNSKLKRWPIKTEEDRFAMYNDLLDLVKSSDIEFREFLLDRLRNWAGKGKNCRNDYGAVTYDELQILAESPVSTIGAHTVSHPRLSSISISMQQYEITQSKLMLENILKRPVDFFSYPFGGRKDYIKKSVEIIREAGFIKAASNYPGQWHRWTDPLQIPRFLIRDWSGDKFEKQIRGFWTE